MPEIGASLREARLRAKLDIVDVESATKIRAKYLRALENEEWGMLPGPAFVKSFLRTYADYLGLDGKLLVDEYKLRHERPSDLDQMPIGPNLGRGRAGRAVSRISPAWIIGIVIVALLGLFAYLGASGGEENNPTPTTTAQSAAQKRAEAKKKAAAAAAARRARIRRQKVKLQIQPTAAIFVCLVNAKGKTVIPGQVLQGGQNTRTFSSKRFRITLGHGGDSTLELNGKPFPIPDSGGQQISYVITRKKRKQLPPGSGPTCQGGTTTGTGTGTTTGTVTG
jgi:cytoskeleton protein RodZ